MIKLRLMPILIAALWFLSWPDAVRAADETADKVVAVAAQPSFPDAVTSLQTPVIVELFTSRDCVFCPPADKVLAALDARTPVLAVGCHVSYFNGGEGGYSTEFCDRHQENYARHMRGSGIYTPQVIVNGRYDVIGYESEKLFKVIEDAAQDGVMPIALSHAAGGEGVEAAFPALGKDGTYKVWLLTLSGPYEQTVRGGRHKGETISYVNVVTAAQDLGDWDGKVLVRAFETPRAEKESGLAIIVQDLGTGHIIAFGALKH